MIGRLLAEKMALQSKVIDLMRDDPELELAYRESTPFTHDIYPESVGVPDIPEDYEPIQQVGAVDFGKRVYSTFPDAWIPDGIKVVPKPVFKDEEFDDHGHKVYLRKLTIVRSEDHQKNLTELSENIREATIRGALNLLRRFHVTHLYSLREARFAVYGRMERKTSWYARIALLHVPNHDPYALPSKKKGAFPGKGFKFGKG